MEYIVARTCYIFGNTHEPYEFYKTPISGNVPRWLLSPALGLIHLL